MRTPQTWGGLGKWIGRRNFHGYVRSLTLRGDGLWIL